MRDLLSRRETARRVLSFRTTLSALVSSTWEHTFTRLKDRIPKIPSDLSSANILPDSLLPHKPSSAVLIYLYLPRKNSSFFGSLFHCSDRALCQKNCRISLEERICKLGSGCSILYIYIECSDSWRRCIETNVRVTMKWILSRRERPFDNLMIAIVEHTFYRTHRISKLLTSAMTMFLCTCPKSIFG